MIKYTELKKPFALLTQEDSNSFSVWWEDEDGTIAVFDNCTLNYPRFTIGSFENKAEAIERIEEMAENGWTLEEKRWENEDQKR